MTTDQNAREAATKALKEASGISPLWGPDVASRSADAAIDAYLAALPLPDDAARVVEPLERLIDPLSEAMPDGQRLTYLIGAARSAIAYIRSQAAALAQMTRDAHLAYDRGYSARDGVVDACRARAEEAESSLATVTAERDRLREALETARAMLVKDGWLPKGLTEIDRALTGGGNGE